MRVELLVDLDVDEEILQENEEELTDAQLASQIYTRISQGSSLSCVGDAVEIMANRVQRFYRIAAED